MKIWLDDIRPPPDKTWTVFREAPVLISWLHNTGSYLFNVVETMSLDHDLGPPSAGTGYDVLNFVESAFHHHKEYCRAHNLTMLWSLPEIKIHTANPVARQRMQLALSTIHRRFGKK